MSETHPPETSGLDESRALQRLSEITAKETGAEFFSALVKGLCEVLGVTGAWVTEYVEDERRLRSLAFWLDGALQPTYEYDVAGTPCELVVAGQFVHVPENVVQLYPEDRDLSEFRAVSYLGFPFADPDGRVLGHVAVVDDEPFPEEPFAVALFKLFAERAGAELRRLEAEAAVREREEQLTGLLESAMDAILVLDANFRVTRTNPAAERVFACSADALQAEWIARFLDDDSFTRLQALARELATEARGRQSAWIPGGLEARGTGGSFPAEASITRFSIGPRTYYALILRNVLDKLEAEREIETLKGETEYLREEIDRLHGFDEIVGRSRPMVRLLRDVERVADTDTTVLIQGETGTGKELVARAIHSASARADRPLIKVNCAAIPDSLIESELFGHEKGAFTGATRTRDGRFALADGGTIFLDEVGELPLGLQSKLLRVLQEGEIERVGSDRTRTVDVRVIAATNRDLESEVERDRFRRDLYYRLAVFPIQVPPLRERGDDVLLLAEHFAEALAREMGRETPTFGPGVAPRLKTYEWPGNVRELQNVIERSMVLAREGPLHLHEALAAPPSAPLLGEPSGGEPSGGEPRVSDQPILTAAELRAQERANLVRALESTAWKVSGEDGAAARLGMPASTLSSRMKALGIRRPG